MPDLPHGIRRGVSLLRTIVSKNTTNCEMCGEEFVPVSVNNRFCSAECRREWWNKNSTPPRLSKRKCLTCGATYMGRRGQKYCTLQCTPAHAIKWKDNEVIYLASINAGYGFKRFVGKLYRSGDLTRQQFRFFGLFDEIKEETGVDLYGILQDPSKMGKVTSKRLHALPVLTPTELKSSHGPSQPRLVSTAENAKPTSISISIGERSLMTRVLSTKGVSEQSCLKTRTRRAWPPKK